MADFLAFYVVSPYGIQTRPLAMQTAAGDAVYWNVGVPPYSFDAICFARLREADGLLAMLRAVGGAPSTQVHDHVISVPNATDLIDE
jgi:hypothetical protein